MEEEFYHVYNRGTDKRTIFKVHSDYVRFQELLFLSNSSVSVNVRDIKNQHDSVFDFDRENQLVAIGAYCLMPNHFHILLTPLTENGVQLFMQRLSTSYSMYFNKRYERTGGLFEGRFKAKHVNEDTYLEYLYAYVHLNPVKLIQSDWKEKGIRDIRQAWEYLERYSYSSFADYMGIDRVENTILSSEKFPEYFESGLDHQQEMLAWLVSYQEEEEGVTKKSQVRPREIP